MTQAANLAALGTNVSSSGIAQAAGGGTAGTNGAIGFKNRIINGNMVIDQRNAGASVTATTSFPYTLDRWQAIASQNSKFTIQQNAGSVTPPAGFTNYLGVTSSSAYTVGISEQFRITQFIEGYNTADLGFGTANAKTVTLSFWVRSSLTGTFGGSLNNSDYTRSYPFSYTISAANTWEQKTITVAGDTSGTWQTTNSTGIAVVFGLGVGSSLSSTAGSWSSNAYISVTGATSVVGTNGATFYITGVQLEVGTAATNFDVRSVGTELGLCQRYFSTSFPYGTAPVQNSGLFTWKVTAISSGYGMYNQFQYPVPMRITATTITGFNGGAANNLVRNVPGGQDLTNLGINPTSTTGFNIVCYGAADAGLPPIGWNWSASAEL
jgi:hypothetical protein